ncbi:O-antigen ligase family protein [Senegalia sp. (in: firmicutes)]|uniref:O-antigen ligase family protein n=1 Tax=Senegalia sp. (in: firmicutes) TaxID=1924098 RepID=UPI003F9BA6C4
MLLNLYNKYEKTSSNILIVVIGALIGVVSSSNYLVYFIILLMITLGSIYLIKRPLHIATLYLCSIPFFPIQILEQQLSTLLTPVIFLAFIVSLFRENGKEKINFKYVGIINIFLMLNFLGLFQSSNIRYSAIFIIKLVICIGLYYIISNFNIISKYDVEKNIHIITGTIIIAASLILVFLIYKYFFVFKVEYISINTDFPSKEGRNQLGFFLALLAPYAIYRLIKNKLTIENFLIKLSSLVLIIGLVLTLSRGAWISTIVGLLAIIAIRKNYKLLILIIIFSLIIGVFMPDSVRDRFLSISNLFYKNEAQIGQDYSSTTVRKELVKISLDTIQSNQLRGIGLGNYYMITRSMGLHDVGVSHNDYLQIATELGVPGLLAFLIFLSRIIKRLVNTPLQHYKESKDIYEPVLASIVTLCVYLMLINAYNSPLMWLILGIGTQYINSIPKAIKLK